MKFNQLAARRAQLVGDVVRLTGGATTRMMILLSFSNDPVPERKK
jgi:hypothetical protein